MRWTWCLAVGANACSSLGASSVYPLYDASTIPRTPAEVATLHGPIATVDGKNVAEKGQAFGLLPGCHIVTLERSVGASDSLANGAWAGTLPSMAVVFRMLPAHMYVIDVQLETSSGPLGKMQVRATERTPAGKVTEVPWMRGESDVEECRRWADQEVF
jgi:hypothetical protein